VALNIGDLIVSFNTFDLLVVFVLMAMFILGFIQGTIRRLLGLAAMLFSFLFAANLREPLGDFLASNWTHLPPQYSVMIGFGTVFVAASIAFTIIIQAFYRKAPLFEKYTVVDELLGGLIGIVQGVLIIGAMIVILDSVFEIPGYVDSNNELPFLREIHDAYDNSGTAALMRGTLIPAFFFVFGVFIPDELRQFFRG
jgi:membrane protein required for colicin V production